MGTRTVAEVIASARAIFVDPAGVRANDLRMQGLVRDALFALKNIRPDLFLGRFATPIGALASGDTLPVDDQFFQPIVDYCVSRVETQDEEHISSGRAALMLQSAAGFLT